MDAKKLIRIGALLIAVFAAVSIIVGVVNVNKSLSSMNDLSPEEAAMVESQFDQAGVDMDSAVGLVSTIGYVTLAITSAFSILKIVVSLLILKKTDRSHNFFIAWGTVFLVFGIFGINIGFNLMGLCNLLAGIVGPVLLVVGGAQLKKQAA